MLTLFRRHTPRGTNQWCYHQSYNHSERSGRDFIEVIKEIQSKLTNLESISAEVVADTAEEMIDQANQFQGMWNVTIKVPCTVEGLNMYCTCSKWIQS